MLGMFFWGLVMFFGLSRAEGFSVQKSRRKKLIEKIKEVNPGLNDGLVILFAGFEADSMKFLQESSFFYYTGLGSPGVVFTIDLNGKSTLYVPNFELDRSMWTGDGYDGAQDNKEKFGVDEVENLGGKFRGYQVGPFSSEDQYKNLLTTIKRVVQKEGKLFMLNPDNSGDYVEQRLALHRFQSFLPEIKPCVIDISRMIAEARRSKDMQEIEIIHKAIEITQMAHEAAAQAIEPGVSEAEVQASLEYIMTSSEASFAFPSIVASGKNGTILHYLSNNSICAKDELIVVDIGARYKNYCADITRTYPVSGKFSDRQRELYTVVLETQEYIASIAKPGYYLKNNDLPEKSLFHLAHKFLEQKGYSKYFTHGLGHYMGLDVHDVGDYTLPLRENDVITIEPGIYIPEERIGIRIEDNYWVVKGGVVCLSDGLVKAPEEIEELVRRNFLDENQDQGDSIKLKKHDNISGFDIGH